MNKLHQFHGQIINLQPKKIYKKSKPEYYGQLYYKLEILTPKQQVQHIYAFANLIKDQQIWPPNWIRPLPP